MKTKWKILHTQKKKTKNENAARNDLGKLKKRSVNDLTNNTKRYFVSTLLKITSGFSNIIYLSTLVRTDRWTCRKKLKKTLWLDWFGKFVEVKWISIGNIFDPRKMRENRFYSTRVCNPPLIDIILKFECLWNAEIDFTISNLTCPKFTVAKVLCLNTTWIAYKREI